MGLEEYRLNEGEINIMVVVVCDLFNLDSKSGVSPGRVTEIIGCCSVVLVLEEFPR